MDTKKHDRFSWAAELLDIKPKDIILEIGCGTGLAVEEIVPQLQGGKILAIDRSDKMIQKAVQRNKKFLNSGKVEFITTDLLHLKTDQKFNKVFCFNINLFWTQKSIAKEVTILKANITKKGLLYICYGPMVASGIEKIKGPLTQNFKNEKINVSEIVIDKKLNCCCFVCSV